MCQINLSFCVILYAFIVNQCASYTFKNAATGENKSLPLTDLSLDNAVSDDAQAQTNRAKQNRYPKLNDLFQKISDLDSLIPNNMDSDDDEEDEEDINVNEEKPANNVTSEDKVKAVGDLSKYEKPVTKQLDDVEYDDYEDADYNEEEDEEMDFFKALYPDDPKLQKLSDNIDRYIAPSDQWNHSETDFNRRPASNNDDADDYDDWDYRQEYQGSQPTAQEEGVPSGGRYNWIHHSTRYQLERARLNHQLKRNDFLEARQHMYQIAIEGACLKPQPKVISIQTLYPYFSKRYVPHCTILHRCGDDTGCCKHDSLTCAVKSFDIIERTFFTTDIGRRGRQLEKLAFHNHTECECILRGNEFMKDDATTATPVFKSVTALDTPVATTADTETEEPMALRRCNCPTEYSPQMQEDGECICDCVTKQKDCTRLKRGKEYFGLKDRRCILKGECQKPTCEFGIYLHKTGRCPRKQEKI